MWYNIKNDNDIKQLFDYFGEFHDSCIVLVSLTTGLSVDNKLYMNYNNSVVRIIFQRQSIKNNCIEIEFDNVRELVMPKKTDCINEITDAIMFFSDDKLYWADSDSFNSDIESIYDGCYVSSQKARWRIK